MYFSKMVELITPAADHTWCSLPKPTKRFLKMYFSKYISQNVFFKMYFSKMVELITPAADHTWRPLPKPTKRFPGGPGWADPGFWILELVACWSLPSFSRKLDLISRYIIVANP